MSSSRFQCITEFSIEGKHYVIGKPCTNGADPVKERQDIQPVKTRPIGELRIDGSRYVVFQADGGEQAEWNREILDLLRALTEREQQIVSRAALGQVNRQIADELRISSHTVSSYLRRIFLKLGVGTRTEMVFKCRKLIEVQRSMNL